MSTIPAGYKQTEIGVIPEEWLQCNIYQHATFITSGSRGWAQYYSDLGSTFLRITNLIRGGIQIDLSDLKYVSVPNQNIEAIRTKLELGDILFSITADIGIIGYIDEAIPFPAYINQHIATIRFDSSKVYSKFVAYYLASENAQKYIGSLVDQGAKAGVNLITISKLPILLPPLPEQQRIAQVLGDVDALIQKLEALIAKKRDIKQASMQELLTGKRRLPGFSGAWETKRLGEVGQVVTGSTPKTDVPAYWGEGFPWITPTDINQKRDMVSSERTVTRKGLQVIRELPANTVLVTCIASIGKNAILRAKGACNQQINAIIPSTSYSPEFLYYTIENSKSYLQSNAGTTATSIISKTTFFELVFIFPPLPEQAAIAQVLSDMDAELEKLEARLAKTRDLKAGLMGELLTGRIRLRVAN